MTRLLILALISVTLAACAPNAEEESEFLEFRLHRWTALEGGETIVIRRAGNEWKARLMGDGQRFSCLYNKEVKPQSDWNQVWNTILAKGARDISSQDRNYGIEDGDGFIGELTENENLSRFEISHPRSSEADSSQKLLDLSDYLSKEFNSPIFVADYDRGKVGEYLINNCKHLRK